MCITVFFREITFHIIYYAKQSLCQYFRNLYTLEGQGIEDVLTVALLFLFANRVSPCGHKVSINEQLTNKAVT